MSSGVVEVDFQTALQILETGISILETRASVIAALDSTILILFLDKFTQSFKPANILTFAAIMFTIISCVISLVLSLLVLVYRKEIKIPFGKLSTKEAIEKVKQLNVVYEVKYRFTLISIYTTLLTIFLLLVVYFL